MTNNTGNFFFFKFVFKLHYLYFAVLLFSLTASVMIVGSLVTKKLESFRVNKCRFDLNFYLAVPKVRRFCDNLRLKYGNFSINYRIFAT